MSEGHGEERIVLRVAPVLPKLEHEPPTKSRVESPLIESTELREFALRVLVNPGCGMSTIDVKFNFKKITKVLFTQKNIAAGREIFLFFFDAVAEAEYPGPGDCYRTIGT